MKHIMELVGKTRVTVVDGKVVSVEDPVLEWCPIFAKYRDIQKITPEEVKKNIEFRIKDFGLFTKNRKLDGFDDFVSFGASEVMYTGLEHGLLDTTVTVCDGAGTVVTSNPELVQGMGGRMSGLVYTEPIVETINAIEERDGYVVDKETAKIDPKSGLKYAIDAGFNKIAVTVSKAEDLIEFRNLAKEKNVDLILIGVHTTGITQKEAKLFEEYSDICTLCASSTLRETKPLLQVGSAVPLVAYTQAGKELLLERAKYVKAPLMVTGSKLPFLPEEKQPYTMS